MHRGSSVDQSQAKPDLTPIVKLSKRIADCYFRPKAIELGGKLHVWLGVRVFKRTLMRLATPAPGSKGSGYWLASRDVGGLRAFERRTRHNEALHLLPLLSSVLALVLVGGSSPWLFVVFGSIFALNFHPILLQRYNRIRILRALARYR